MTVHELHSPAEHRAAARRHCVMVAEAHPDAAPDELRAALVAMMQERGVSPGRPWHGHEIDRGIVWSNQADITVRERRRQRGEVTCQYSLSCPNEAALRDAGVARIGLCAAHFKQAILLNSMGLL